MTDAIRNQTVLVAGGSGGIGSAVCRELVRRGWTVAFTYHRGQAKAEILAAELGAEAIGLDLTDAAATAQAVNRLVEQHGRLDAVVYAAGPTFEMAYVAKIAPATWAETMAADVNGCFNLFSAALPHFRAAKHGSLVSMSTCALRRPPKADVLSAAPKAAIDMLVKCIAKEEGRNGIRANTVEVGFISVGLAAHYIEHVWSPEIIDGIVKETPLRRFGTGEDIAKAVAFLCSDESSFITGEAIAVDGGYHL